MTRAALLALRAAGQLRTECHYIITDGPVIGTPGNTSATVIELHAVTPTDIAREAKVSTVFDDVAFTGSYDIDAGAAGSLNALTDHWNNQIGDEDADAPTVQTEFPFHLSGPNLRDNTVNDCSLPGWAAAVAAGVAVTDNTLQESTVDLTGKTSGTFQRNELSASSVTATVPASFITGNTLNLATVDHLGTSAGSFSFQQNTMLTGSLTVDAATTSQVTFNNNVIGGAAGGYRVEVQGKTGGPVIISGNRLFNNGPGAYDLRAGGTGVVNVTANEVGAGTITSTSAGDLVLTGNTLSGALVTHLGSGVFTMSGSTATGGLVNTQTTSTRGLTVNSSVLNQSNVTQNGTGSTNADRFPTGSANLLHRCNILFHATSAATPVSDYTGLTVTSNATIDVADHTAATPILGVHVDTGSVLNLSAAGTASNSRFSSGAVVNLAHPASSCIVDGQFTKTSTGTNTNTLTNAAFDSFV